jgi:phage-related protein
LSEDLGPVELEFTSDAEQAAEEVRELAGEAKALADSAIEAKAGLDEMRDSAAEVAEVMGDFRDQVFETGEALDEVRDHAAEAAEADQALADGAFEAAEALGHLRDEAFEAREALNGLRDSEVEAGAAAAGEGAAGIGVMSFAIVALLGLAAAILPAFVAAAGGIGAFALLAYPAIEKVVTGLGDTKAELAKLPAPVREIVGEIKGLKDEWERLGDSLRPEMFTVINQALRVARTLLPEIVPLAKAGGEALAGMLRTIGRGVDSSGFRDFLHMLTSMVGPAVRALTHLAGVILGILGNAITTLAPISVPFITMLTNLLHAAGPGLANALDFIAQVLMDIGQAITPLLGPLGSLLGFMAHHSWVSQFAAALVGVVIGIKMIAWAMGILDTVMDANPIVLIIAALALLAFAFIELWKRSEGFRDFWKDLWRDVKAAALDAWHFIDNDVIHPIEHAFGDLVTWLKAHWELLPAIFLGPLGIVDSIVLTHLHTLEGWFRDGWNAIKGIVMPAVRFIATIIKANLDLIEGVAKSTWDVIVGVFQAAWDIIRGVVTTTVGEVVGIIKAAWDLVEGIFEVFADLIEGHWHAAWTTLASTARQLLGNIVGIIRDGVAGFGSLLWNAGVALVKGLLGGIESMFGSVGSVVGSLAHKVAGFFGLSPAIEGPLSGGGAPYIRGLHFAADIASGILAGRHSVAAAVAELAQLTGLVSGGHPAATAAALGGTGGGGYAAGGGAALAGRPMTVNVPITMNGVGDANFLHWLQQLIQEAILRATLNNQGNGLFLPGKLSG